MPPTPALAAPPEHLAPVPADDDFSPYAVTTRTGPHVTIQAGVVQGDRFWTTTSRSSLKARSVRAHGRAAAMIDGGEGLVRVIAGPTRALDLLRPGAVLAHPIRSALAVPAVLAMAGGHANQMLGYLESATRIPADWFPHRRVVLCTTIESTLTLRGHHLVDATGRWSVPATPAEHLHPRDEPRSAAPLVPTEVRGLLRTDAPVRVGIQTVDGPVVLPARWRGDDRYDVSADALAVVGAVVPGRGCVTFDDSASRRPDDKRGVMLRGALALVAVDGSVATVALRPERITTWDGFSAATVDT